jgi:hypothetical protein
MISRADCKFAGIGVLTGYWPILIVEFPEHRFGDEDNRALLEHLEALMNDAVRTGEKLYFITDLTLMREFAPARQRQYTGQWIKRTTPLAQASSVGGAQVTPSAVLRGIITAIFWVQPPPTPAVCVATRSEAMRVGIERLEAAHVVLPPRLASYRDEAGALAAVRSGGARR